MRLELQGATNNLTAINDLLEDEPKAQRKRIIKNLQKFGQNCARVCYTSKDFSELMDEPFNQDFVNGLLDRGHHSVFEHINFNS